MISRPYYFGEIGPVWAASAKAAVRRVEKFSYVKGELVAVEAETVENYLRPALLGIGRPVFGSRVWRPASHDYYVGAWETNPVWV